MGLLVNKNDAPVQSGIPVPNNNQENSPINRQSDAGAKGDGSDLRNHLIGFVTALISLFLTIKAC